MKKPSYLVFILALTLTTLVLEAQNTPEMGDRFAFTSIFALPANDNAFGGGFSIYSSVWPLFETYPKTEHFQTGLISAWMSPQPTGSEPTDEFFYNTIEGGLGWWTDLRFGHEVPKFTMGGVSNGFYSWANGPGAGQAELVDDHRDWSQPNGMLGIAQLSNNLLWPPDGLNMATSNNGEFLGYGYIPLPFTEEMPTTNGVNITTGNQSWTLFLNTENFKGPVAFFLPTFWTKPVLEDPSLEGLFLDTRPSEPLSSFGFETATLPVVNSIANDGTRYSKALPTRYPITEANESVLLNRPMVYSKDAMWTNVESWFNGGPVAPTAFATEGQLEILFDTEDSQGSAFFESKIKLEPGGDDEDDEYDIETTYIQPFVKDSQSWGFQMDMSMVEDDNGIFKTPTYFELNDALLEGNPIELSEVPTETGLVPYEFETNTEAPLPYLTPLETDCPWHDPNGVWLNPGPVAGPFEADLEDGSTITYYWYRFIDQPAVLAANLPNDQRTLLQQRVEMIHANWQKTDTYLPSQTRGNLANLDNNLIIEPPSGFEIGYVPIVTRQEKSTTLSIVDTNLDDVFTIYPNPTSSNLYFTKPIQSVDVYSINGSKILSRNSVSEINVSTLSRGLYILKIYLPNGSLIVNKLIKK